MSTFRINDDIEMTDAPQKMNLTRFLHKKKSKPERSDLDLNKINKLTNYQILQYGLFFFGASSVCLKSSSLTASFLPK